MRNTPVMFGVFWMVSACGGSDEAKDDTAASEDADVDTGVTVTFGVV